MQPMITLPLRTDEFKIPVMDFIYWEESCTYLKYTCPHSRCLSVHLPACELCGPTFGLALGIAMLCPGDRKIAVEYPCYNSGNRTTALKFLSLPSLKQTPISDPPSAATCYAAYPPISAPPSAATCYAAYPVILHLLFMAGWRLLSSSLLWATSSSSPCPAFLAIAKSEPFIDID
ncbi:hypothetical protein STEG23_012591 [Scotinomys teguina]